MALFSKTNNHFHRTESETVLVPYEKTVHEHRAPTDKSVQLLNEMQEKATQNIIETIRLEGNGLSAVALCFENNSIVDIVTYHIRFELNGKKHLIKGDIEKRELSEARRLKEEAINIFFKKFSEAICKEILMQSTDVLKEVGV
jgi:hypothetical protein